MHYDIPYVPSTDEKVRQMISLASVRPGEKAADLGCGDGRVVIELAKYGATVDGYEIDATRAALARNNVLRKGQHYKARIYHKNFWDRDFSEYDIITVYGITSIMDRLEKKLQKELRPGARVISNTFSFPHWVARAEKEDVYLYVKE